jgi:molybdopterin synthase catalytic subunit
MAAEVLADIATELERELPGTRVAIHHRTGSLAVGEAAVAIAAAAPHRAEAFSACRAAIDRLKERAPIWKKEIGESGEVWLGLGA